MSNIESTSFDFTTIIGRTIKTDLELGHIIYFGETEAVFDLTYSGNKYRNPKKLICKVSSAQEAHLKELQVITAATKLFDEIKTEEDQDGPIPKIVKNGTFESQDVTLSYLIMKKCDLSLADFLQQKSMSFQKVIYLAKEIIAALQLVHATGYVYKNMKIKNIVMMTKHGKLDQMKLTDYSAAERYVDEDGYFLECRRVESTENSIFASLNQLNSNSVSRKDDLISLCYLLFLILNDGELPFLDYSQLKQDDDGQHNNDLMIQIKKEHDLIEMAESLRIPDFKKQNNLIKFATNIQNLNFKQKPNYQQLFKLLDDCLNDEIQQKNIQVVQRRRTQNETPFISF